MIGSLTALIVLSTDPTLTAAAAATPLSQQVEADSAVLQVRTTNNQNSGFPNLALPIESGRTYFVAASAATRVLLYLDDPPQLT